MASVYVAWAVSAVVLLGLAIWIGVAANGHYFGILIDSRGRYSLAQLRLVLWSIVVLSLLGAYIWGRLQLAPAKDVLNFGIPNNVLILLGISLGSAAAATVVKAQKNGSPTDANAVAASSPADPPRFAQVFLVEEGTMADRAVDVTKYQNFWITLIFAAAYVATAIQQIGAVKGIGDLASLPDLSGTLVTLLGLSHVTYIAGKVPDQSGQPPGLTYAMLAYVGPKANLPEGVAPRNPPKSIPPRQVPPQR